MWQLIALLFLFSCSHNPEVPNETPETPTEGTSPVGEPGPIQPAPVLKLGSSFLVHDEISCGDIPDDFDVIFFDPGTTGDELDELKDCIKKFKNAGRLVGAYMSGTGGETYRDDYEDLVKFKIASYPGYPKEFWVDINNPEVAEIMFRRMDNFKALGFQGLYSDNSTMYQEDFGITLEQNKNYLIKLSEYANSIGLFFIINGGEEIALTSAGKFSGYMGEDIADYGKGWANYKNVIGKYPIFEIAYRSRNCVKRDGVHTYYASGLGYGSYKRACL